MSARLSLSGIGYPDEKTSFEDCFEGVIVERKIVLWRPNETMTGYYNASPQPCSINHQVGQCMFTLQCLYLSGKPIGACRSGLFYQSCCVINHVGNVSSEIEEESEENSNETTHEEQAVIQQTISFPTSQETSTEGQATFTVPSLLTSTMTSTAEIPITKPSAVDVNVNVIPGTVLESDCGLSSNRTPRIVNGTEAAIGSWPWQISIAKYDMFGISHSHHCGGALINPQWVVTAAHCMHRALKGEFVVIIGDHDLSSDADGLPSIRRKIQKVIPHPDFAIDTFENDIALLKLNEPVIFGQYISPICLPSDDNLLVGRTAYVTGWGRLSDGGPRPSKLQELLVPIIDNTMCEDYYSQSYLPQTIPLIFICAGYPEGGRDACQGDSGSPLQVLNDQGRFFLAGIVSWGIGCGEPLQPGGYARISFYKNWILKNIEKFSSVL